MAADLDPSSSLPQPVAADAPAAIAAPRKFRYSAPTPLPGNPAAPAVALPADLPSLPLGWDRITIALLVAALCLVALYLTEIEALADRWYSDPGWSHGFVVPLISIFFISTKWDTLRRLTPRGSWIGLAVALLGVVGQVLFRATGTVHMSNLSILVVLFGLTLFIFGWQHMKVLWLPIGFLIFSIPPPGTMYVALTTPMQKIAAELGVRLLPLFGGMGFREGTTIQVQQGAAWVGLDVEQACSGMRMLVAFFALAVALAYSTPRPTWQKLFLSMAALPIAILCNAFRVTLTGVLAARYGMEWAKGSTHQMVGLLMLIPALGMQLGLGWILDRIFIDDGTPTGGPR